MLICDVFCVDTNEPASPAETRNHVHESTSEAQETTGVSAASSETTPGGNEPVAGPSGTAVQLSEDLRSILGDIVIPEGVDPSFLAALPEEIRQEVINEHLRT